MLILSLSRSVEIVAVSALHGDFLNAALVAAPEAFQMTLIVYHFASAEDLFSIDQISVLPVDSLLGLFKCCHFVVDFYDGVKRGNSRPPHSQSDEAPEGLAFHRHRAERR